MKVHLIIPPSAFLLDDRAFPFLGPLQIAALARERGHDVRVSDLTGYRRRHTQTHADAASVLVEAQAQLARELDQDTEVVGYYSLAAQHPMVVALLGTGKAVASGALHVIGGPHASTAPDRCVADGFDLVVVSDQGGGGGEPGFLEALERAKTGRRSLMKVLRVPSRAGVEWECDRWPLPARDLIDLPSYRYELNGERCTSIVSATGCPYACTYCSHWEGYRKLEAKSAKRVAEEIVAIRHAYGYRAVMFYDDEINLRPDFMTEFLPMLRKQDVLWRAFWKSGRTFMKPELFAAMSASGCVQLCTGAESADPGILKAIKKGATLADNTAFVELCVRHRIAPKVFTQVGLPGETPKTIQALRDWLVAMVGRGLRDADVSITTPYEGTPIYDHPEQHAITFDKAQLDFSSKVVNYKGIPGEYSSFVSHPDLTPDDLVAARQWVEDEFRAAAGLPKLAAKDDG